MIEKLELLAIKSVALKDPEYFYRRVCRYYSEKFHTPLRDVHDLPWAFVFTNYLEHLIEENNTQEGIYNLAIEVCYPERKMDEENEIQEWIKNIEKNEEEKRKAKGKKQNPRTHKNNDENKSTNKTDKENPHKESEEKEISVENDLFTHLEEEMEEDIE